MSRYNPDFPDAARVHAVARTFAEKCLIGQRSLFLPESNPLSTEVWQAQTFAELVERYVDRPDIGKGNFVEKLKIQLSAASPPSVVLITEIAWAVYLAVNNLLPASKLERLSEIWGMGDHVNPPLPRGVEELTNEVLAGLGSGGQGFNTYFWRELVCAIRSFHAFILLSSPQRLELLQEPRKFAVWLNGIDGAAGRQFYHCLIHLFFPDDFERVFSGANKTKFLRAFSRWEPEMDSDRPGQDQELLSLRRHLERRFSQEVDYYAPPLENASELNPAKSGEGAAESSMVEELFGDESAAEEAPSRPARNVVFYGPPGTGKTRVLENLRQAAYRRGDYFMFVTFHPSYAYEDFVVGLRPEVKDGAVMVARKDGPFVKLCQFAHADPQRRFILFIDEINRANTSKVFGELITLIEPGRRVPPGTVGDQDHLSVTLPLLDQALSVPSNIDIFASMNSADRSLVHLDTALRRRFEFIEILPDPDAIKPSHVEGVDLRALLKQLNRRLEWLLDRDHLIGHALFMGIASLDDLRARLRTSIIPLLEEFFFEDRTKVGIALLGKSDARPFVQKRAMNPAKLFAEADLAIEGIRYAITVGNEEDWGVDDFKRIYGESAQSAPEP